KRYVSLTATILQLTAQRHDYLFLQRSERPAGSFQAHQHRATTADEPNLRLPRLQRAVRPVRPHHQAHDERQVAIRRFSHVFRRVGHRFSTAWRPSNCPIGRPVHSVGAPGDRRLKMNAIETISPTDRYARCVETSKRVRWDIEKDVIRGRRFDTAHKFLPDGLSLAEAFTTLSADEKRFVSQIQGRTYANIFGLVE